MTAPTEANDLISTLQDFTIFAAGVGVLIAIFGKKIRFVETAKPAPKRQPKRTKRKGAKPGKQARKTRKAKPKAKAGETPKQWAKVPEYSAESLERISRYQMQRDGIKGGTNIPL